jgi:hypothetical protein
MGVNLDQKAGEGGRPIGSIEVYAYILSKVGVGSSLAA